jgi:hypothetical protein
MTAWGIEFLEEKNGKLKREIAAFEKTTGYNVNKKKVRELAAEIRRRLDATAATTVPFSLAVGTVGVRAGYFYSPILRKSSK